MPRQGCDARLPLPFDEEKRADVQGRTRGASFNDGQKGHKLLQAQAGD